MDLIDFAADLLVLATVISTALFVVLYSVLFDPGSTTAGRMIRRMMLALLVLGVVTVVRAFLPEVPDWWPLVRLGMWLYLTFSFGSLVWLVLVRRFWPKRLKTRPNEDTLQPRPVRRRR